MTVIPSAGFVSHLGDRKVGAPVQVARPAAGPTCRSSCDVTLQVQDSDAAGVIIDLIRIAAIARRRGETGFPVAATTLLKSPALVEDPLRQGDPRVGAARGSGCQRDVMSDLVSVDLLARVKHIPVEVLTGFGLLTFPAEVSYRIPDAGRWARPGQASLADHRPDRVDLRGLRSAPRLLGVRKPGVRRAARAAGRVPVDPLVPGVRGHTRFARSPGVDVLRRGSPSASTPRTARSVAAWTMAHRADGVATGAMLTRAHDLWTPSADDGHAGDGPTRTHAPDSRRSQGSNRPERGSRPESMRRRRSPWSRARRGGSARPPWTG
ncbi:hypothetical protein SFUMM280S_09995 [Streptomyces fumanus]